MSSTVKIQQESNYGRWLQYSLVINSLSSRYHYWRSTDNNWTRAALTNLSVIPIPLGKRGKVVAYKTNLIMVLPDNAPNSTALTLISSTAENHFRDWRTIFETEGNGWEPVFDRYRLADGVLSMMIINGSEVQVWDLTLSDEWSTYVASFPSVGPCTETYTFMWLEENQFHD